MGAELAMNVTMELDRVRGTLPLRRWALGVPTHDYTQVSNIVHGVYGIVIHSMSTEGMPND